MKHLLFKLRRFTIFSVASALIFLAISQGAVRLLLPIAHDQRERLATELSELLKAEITIGRIDSHWNYFVPYLDLLDVSVLQTEKGEKTQKLQRLSVGLNIFDMLRAGSFAPSTLQLDGLHILLSKNTQGDFYFPGLQLPNKSDEPLSIDLESLLGHKRVTLSNASFVLRHENLDTQLDFADIALDFTSSGNHYQGLMTLFPPQNLGAEAQIAFDLKGDLASPKTWQGKANINIPTIQLQALKTYFPESLQITQGHFSLDLDLQLNQSGIASSRGDVDLLFDFKSGKKLSWQSSIHAKTEAGKLNLSMASPLTFGQQHLNVLQGLGMQLDFSEKLKLGLHFIELDLSKSGDLLESITVLPQPWPRRLKAMQLSGQVKDFFVGWDSDNSWNASAKLQNLQVHAVDKLPGISNLNADMLLKQGILSFQLEDQAFEFDSAGLFPEVFSIQRLSTRLDIYKDSDDWVVAAPSLFLDTEDIKTHSNFEMRFAQGKKPFLTLNASAENGDASKTMRYVPTILKPTTLAWFKQGFISGRIVDADAYIKGYVNELVRENSDAIFRVDAKAENATFSYAKDWPIVENLAVNFHMDGVRMEVETQSAEILGIQPKAVRAVIPNCRKTSLELTVSAPHSPMQGLLNYVKQSPLDKLVGGAGGLFEGDGYADVAIELKKNISKVHYEDLKAYFDGAIRLQDTTLNIPSLDIQLDQLSGNVDFSHKSVHSKKLSGKVNEQAFRARVETQSTESGPRATLAFNTQLSLQDVVKARAPLFTDRIEGRSVWRGSIDIPLSKGQKSASLNARSQLKGTAINFPAPLNKSKDTSAAMNVFIALNKTESNRVWLNYKSLLQSVLVFNRQDGGLYSGRLRYRKGRPELPRGPGVTVEAVVDDLDVSPWLELVNTQSKGATSDSLLQRINLQSDLLTYGGVTVKNLQGNLRQHPTEWVLEAQGEGVKGKLVVAKDKNLPFEVKLNSLDLNRLIFPDDGQQAHAEPKQIPSTLLTVDRFVWDDIELSNLTADLQTEEQGLRIKSYAINDPDLKVIGEGFWRSNEGGLQHSFIEFKASTEDMSKGLQKVDVNNLLKNGEGDFKGALNWKKPPYQLDFPSLSGSIEGEVKRGDLLAVKPGIAKLFGLLNVQSLPKRLALNFKDLSSKGLAFDRAQTHIVIDQGIASFQTMKIDTDLGEINIEGRTDLVKKELDQIAKVNPDVSNIIPITAGVVGGVPGLVGALLVDQVVKIFGGDADRVAQVRFKINGSWEDPNVESTRVDRVKDLTKVELRQRAEELIIKNQGIDYEQDVVPGKLELSDEEEQSLFDDE